MLDNPTKFILGFAPAALWALTPVAGQTPDQGSAKPSAERIIATQGDTTLSVEGDATIISQLNVAQGVHNRTVCKNSGKDITYTDGGITTRYLWKNDGAVTIDDGSTLTIAQSDDTVIIKKPDGTVTTSNADGSIRLVLADGFTFDSPADPRLKGYAALIRASAQDMRAICDLGTIWRLNTNSPAPR